ncbi:Crp/Fnr family transcriptional regulator [Hymenobacter sp. CRA2]|uniref:Crp/Fnr family transcriptional regulator n=1 Tax=Hymenobacter sp. CRA2 TaxID=1955620 RepID=UPI00098F461E|nr:Crp/Fnr family transcriptional regulator [Hymenobacter sp. CRA2]OON68860.1 cyclic nucleotide-binding protein [Hymenobacter sp. CRA2]
MPNDASPYAPLLAHIARYVALTEDEQAALLAELAVCTLPRKACLLEQDHVCTASYFVLQGCLRMYFISDKGAEQITHFAIENWWLADYTSLSTQTPSQFFVQAVEPSTVALLDYQQQESLLSRVPKLERYFRLMMQRVTAAAQMRILYLYGQSGEQRYHHFATAFPDFVQRVPQYMLASYLGFTPEFLSKIRAKAAHQALRSPSSGS